MNAFKNFIGLTNDEMAAFLSFHCSQCLLAEKEVCL